MTEVRPRIAIVPGDPSGIGPELIAKLLHEEGVRAAADILLVGDAHLWRKGGEQAGLPLDLVGVRRRRSSRCFGLAGWRWDTIADSRGARWAAIGRPRGVPGCAA